MTHLCAANRRIVLVLANKSIVRVDQSKPDASMEIVDLSKTIGPKAKVQQAFLDPRGNHLILTLKSTGGFYILLSLRQYVFGGILAFSSEDQTLKRANVQLHFSMLKCCQHNNLRQEHKVYLLGMTF